MCSLFKTAVVSGLKGNSNRKSLFLTAGRYLPYKQRREEGRKKREGKLSFLKCERDRLGLHPLREIVLAHLRDTSYENSLLHHSQ